MKQLLLFTLILGFWAQGQAQQKAWIFFNDKGEQVEERLSHPEKLLSTKALDRRQAKGIAVDASDLPVYKNYIESLKLHNLRILSSSRWLNAVAVDATPEALAQIKNLDFVKSTSPLKGMIVSGLDNKQGEPILDHEAPNTDMPMDYGDALTQNTMINIQALHAQGFRGEGVTIAIFDGGFSAADTIDVFDSLWAQKRIIAWYDFVDNEKNVFDDNDHGTNVMSTIGANMPGEMIGTAPHATFVLARTEDVFSETQREEHNWVRALEWADSIGVDVIHSSLGYSQFDDEDESYTYEDMDGNTAIITRAADRAAAKGMLITSSAGNEGSGSWHYITAPSDGDSVLCIGAVTKSGKRSSFSSFGPASDGRIKPDIVAMGSRVTVATPRNYISRSDGTSFSGPIVAGMVVCLRQAHPKRPAMDIFKAIQISGDQYNFPDGGYGYGIPDAGFADSLLTHVEDLSTVTREMEEKPGRGTPKVKKVEKKIEFTANPKTKLEQNAGKLILSAPSYVRKIEIMFGEQHVVLSDKEMEILQKSAQFNTDFLMKGQYYIHIKTADYEENIKFTL